MNKDFFKDPVSRNIGYISALVFVVALQVLILLVFMYQFIPLTMAPAAGGIPSTLLKLFHPNRNYFFYHAFVATAIIGQAMVLYIFRKRLGVPELAGKIREFLMAETVWVVWQLFAVFKILQYDNPQWARILLYAGFAAALLAKIFWPELKRGLKLFKVWLGQDIPALWRRLADGGIILILLSAIMIPDGERALLRMAMVDHTNHFNQWLMTPLWAYHKGADSCVTIFRCVKLGSAGFSARVSEYDRKSDLCPCGGGHLFFGSGLLYGFLLFYTFLAWDFAGGFWGVIGGETADVSYGDQSVDMGLSGPKRVAPHP